MIAPGPPLGGGGRRARAFLALACCLVACGPPDAPEGGDEAEGDDAPVDQPAPDPAALAESHRRMIETLRQVADSSESAPYIGRGTVRDLREKLAALGPSAPLGERIRLHFQTGIGETILGDVEEGISHLERARALLPRGHRLATRLAFELGVAYMRLGETRNCCLRNTPDSCIMPLRGGGVHRDREGSKRAVEYFLEVLGATPPDDGMHFVARWLLNVAHMTLGSYPDGVPAEYLIPPERFESAVAFPRFENVASRRGVDNFSLSGGAIADDFDNDGDLDIVTSTWHPSGQMRFFRNSGEGTFSDRTEEAGLTGLFGGLNLLQTDYDNDGNLDVLVLRGAWLMEWGRMPNSLLHNNGDGTFTDVTFHAGLADVNYPTQTAGWADYDNDGDLDLFIGNEVRVDIDYIGNSEPSDLGADARCQLFRNDGDGTFTDVAVAAGVAYRGYPKGVAWGDYDGDRFPDLYLSEYSGPNRLYHNDGDGTFTEVAATAGVTEPLKSFPTWFWDFDNDGALDLFVASYSGRMQHVGAYYVGVSSAYELPGMYRGDGRGGFTQVARDMDLTYPMLPMGANFGDLDNDGFLDFYLGTGDPSYYSLMPNLMYLNRGGRAFADVSMAGGFAHLQKGHGVAFADLDNDGDQDVFEEMGGAFPGDKYNDALYENPGFGNHWIAIQLVGTRSNRAAIGARIRLRIDDGGAERWVYRHVNSGGSFGANPLRQTIGLGSAARVSELEVYWPTSDLTQVFGNVPANRAVRIVEGRDGFETIDLGTTRAGS